MDLLVTVDSNYLPYLRVLMTSIRFNNPEEKINLYLLHSNIAKVDISCSREYLEKIDIELFPINVGKELFDGAPITDRYPKEMYYRLMAYKLLPENIDKILYLDPDILVINSLDKLWHMNIDNYLFAAAAHTGKTELANDINRIRLGIETDYYNSGVLLINLKRCRKEIKEQDIYGLVSNTQKNLLLPDQDVLNVLYGKKILALDDSKWNYDARNYSNYLLRSGREKDMEWVMYNTSVIHFCGRDKPWKKNYSGRFCALYKHYMVISECIDNMPRNNKTNYWMNDKGG